MKGSQKVPVKGGASLARMDADRALPPAHLRKGFPFPVTLLIVCRRIVITSPSISLVGKDRARILSALGDTVRERRLELGLSQEAVAERAGLHRTYIGSVERGERNVSLANIFRLATALDLAAWDLLRRSELRRSRRS